MVISMLNINVDEIRIAEIRNTLDDGSSRFSNWSILSREKNRNRYVRSRLNIWLYDEE